jgi:serine protease Do
VAGIERGDVVVTIDGQKVEYTAQLQQLVGFRRPGEVVKVEVARKGGARRVFNVRLIAQGDPNRVLAAKDPAESPEKTPEAKSTEVKERLGVTVSPITPDLLRQVEIPNTTKGVVVESVDPYGPADNLLFVPPNGVDIITEVEGKPIRSEIELRAALRAARPGEVVSLIVMSPTQDGKPVTRIVRVKLK